MNFHASKNINFLFFTTFLTSFFCGCLLQSAISAPRHESVASQENQINLPPENNLKFLAIKPYLIAQTIVGEASWYGPGFHGRLTANGETFDQNAMTAAHRSLAFGTQVRVTNLDNGKEVTVRINDRGPFIGNRIIDLSQGAASSIGMLETGVATVRVEVLEK